MIQPATDNAAMTPIGASSERQCHSHRPITTAATSGNWSPGLITVIGWMP